MTTTSPTTSPTTHPSLTAPDGEVAGHRPALPSEALWALTLDARRADADARDEFARALPAIPGLERCLVLVTCHRVEVYGRDPRVPPAALARAAGAKLLAGDAAVRHLLRVATGLESAVVGEDQVLSQLRASWRALREGGDPDPIVDRLAQASLAVGRRVRRGGRPREHGLAARALRWLEPRLSDVDRPGRPGSVAPPAPGPTRAPGDPRPRQEARAHACSSSAPARWGCRSR